MRGTHAVMLDVNHVFQKAFGLHVGGCPAEAEPLYRQVLAVQPEHVDSLHLLGVAAYDAGRNHEALDLIGRAIALNGAVADFHCNMGLVLAALGRSDQAVAHYTRAIAIDPRHALSYNNLGNELAGQGKPVEAEARLRRAIALEPGYSEAHYNLANALGAQGRLDEAVAHYRRTLALAPNFANAHNNLGTTLERQGKLDEAGMHWRRAVELEPQNAGAHYNIGNLLRSQADYGAAIAHYKQALAVRPDYADAWNNMGAAFAEQGDLDAAREAYQKAVEADPTRAAYHRNLASSKRFVSADDPQLAVLERLAADLARVPERERIDLQFALGKAYADVNQHDRSFRHLLAGNKLKRAQLNYSAAESLAYMHRIRDVFSAYVLRRKADGEDAATPVFIVGMPRSGTTLIEQIIASHPSAFGAGELFDLDNIVQSLGDANGGSRFPEIVSTMSGEELREAGARYVAATRALAPSAHKIADKMPWNFHFVGLIHLALPNARIIHARRDPVDTCLSCFSILFDGDSNPYTYDLAELGRFYRSYESLMAHWREVLPPGIMIEVQYEQVVAELENEARRIIAHCGLEWDDACLAFHKTRRPVRTSSVAQVRQPIYRSSIGRWRPYREHLQPLLTELGIDAEDAVADPGTGRQPSTCSHTVTASTGKHMFDTNQALAHAIGLHQTGRQPEAEGIYRQILAVDPNHIDALHLLGVIAHEAGQNEQAIELIGKAIARNDRVADFHSNIASALGALGRKAEAEAHFRRAISLNPDHPESHNNFGNILKEQGRLTEAEGHLRGALAARPDYVEAHYNLGNVLLGLGRTDEAVQQYTRTIALRPQMASAHYNLGHALRQQGKLPEAVEAYRRAIAIEPAWADAHNNLGSVLCDLDRLAEAEASFRLALASRPDNATALANLAATVRPAGRIEEAITCMRRALELDPDNAVHHTNFIFALNFEPNATAADHQAERARYYERHASRYAGSIRPHGNSFDPHRRLRIGYVSAHFRHQAATFAFGSAITNHDRERFEVICYSDTPEEDEVSAQLRACSAAWHRTAKLSDAELAELIRSDRIDILVDLVGHMSGHRLLVFARKPAPVQVTGWGEPTGTGLKTMDYLFADPVLVPASERDLLAEKVADLPNFLGFWLPEPLPDISPLPALARGYVTFGSFNRLDKMQDPVVRIWARILNALPGSRLILKNRWLGEPVQRDRIMALFTENEVAPEHVQLLGPSSRLGHFSGYNEIDLALDTFPHGGGMTTIDALWMGVPVVTSPGATISSRLAAASLTAAGLSDFIAADLDGYVELAVAKAQDLSALAELRAGLRNRMNASTFGDGVGYARAVGARYREMWQRWCAEGAHEQVE